MIALHVANVAERPFITFGGYGVASFGAVVAVTVCYAAQGIWKAIVSPTLKFVAGIGFSSKFLRVSFHPFSWATHFDRTVQNYLGTAIAGSERALTWAIGQMLWTFIDLTATVVKLAYDTYEGLRGIGHSVTKTVTQTITHTVVKPVTRTVTKLDTKATTLLRSLNADVARLQHRMTALAHTVEALPARVGVTPKQIARLARRTSALEKATVGVGAVALVGTALARMGLGWTRCPNVGRLGKHLCGMPSALMDALLAGLTLVIATEGLVPFARQVQGVIGEAAPLVGKFWHASAVGHGGDRSLGSSTLD